MIGQDAADDQHARWRHDPSQIGGQFDQGRREDVGDDDVERVRDIGKRRGRHVDAICHAVGRGIGPVIGTDAGAMSIASPATPRARRRRPPAPPNRSPHRAPSRPSNICARRALIDSIVVGWSPTRTSTPGRCATPSRSGSASNGTQAGQTTRSSAIHTGSACPRHVLATDSSTSTSRHVHCVKPSRCRPDRSVDVVAERGPQLDARRRRRAPRWRRLRATTAHRRPVPHRLPAP